MSQNYRGITTIVNAFVEPATRDNQGERWYFAVKLSVPNLTSK